MLPTIIKLKIDVFEVRKVMNGLQSKSVQCPCCWETFEAVIDCSVNEQEYVEDCYVCCRPLVFQVQADGAFVIDIKVTSENQ